MSDNVGVDEAEPEVLLTHNQHAREHLTVEMALYELGELTGGYATDARVRAIVDSREIWIVPSVNPDGAEFDVATGSYALWRKNRQPNAGSIEVGTDLNRNWGYQWGCCGGSSSSPGSEIFRGTAPFSAPETQVVSNFVAIAPARRRAADQGRDRLPQLRRARPVAVRQHDRRHRAGHAQDERDTFATLGASMAQASGYTPQQGSDLYITDGAIDDWLWGAEGVFEYTVEMYPATGGAAGFYPGDEVIAAQTSRNREAVLRLLEAADCPYRVIGKDAQYCPPPRRPAAGAAAAAIWRPSSRRRACGRRRSGRRPRRPRPPVRALHRGRPRNAVAARDAEGAAARRAARDDVARKSYVLASGRRRSRCSCASPPVACCARAAR